MNQLVSSVCDFLVYSSLIRELPFDFYEIREPKGDGHVMLALLGVVFFTPHVLVGNKGSKTLATNTLNRPLL